MNHDGGLAFPCAPGAGVLGSFGMSLRDYLAAHALQGLIASMVDNEVVVDTPQGRLAMRGLTGIPHVAYQYADAMLAERAKVTP